MDRDAQLSTRGARFGRGGRYIGSSGGGYGGQGGRGSRYGTRLIMVD